MTPEERERQVKAWAAKVEQRKPKPKDEEKQRIKTWLAKLEKEAPRKQQRHFVRSIGGALELLRTEDAEKPPHVPVPRAPPKPHPAKIERYSTSSAYGGPGCRVALLDDSHAPPEWFEHEHELPRAVREVVEREPALHAVDDWFLPDNTDLWSEEDEYEFINKVPRPYGISYPFLYRPG